jgi:hypothetical protein
VSSTTYRTIAPAGSVAISTYQEPGGQNSGYSQSSALVQQPAPQNYYEQSDTRMVSTQLNALGQPSATSGNFGGYGPHGDMTASQGQGNWAAGYSQTGSAVPGFSYANVSSSMGPASGSVPTAIGDTAANLPSTSGSQNPVPEPERPADGKYYDDWSLIRFPEGNSITCDAPGSCIKNKKSRQRFVTDAEWRMLEHWSSVHNLTTANQVYKHHCDICFKRMFFDWEKDRHDKSKAHLENKAKQNHQSKQIGYK